MMNIEQYLLENDFELHTYSGTNKRFIKEITDYQNLYVRIYSDTNKIVEVEYEHNPLSKFDNHKIISFETIDSYKKLEFLIKALTN